MSSLAALQLLRVSWRVCATAFPSLGCRGTLVGVWLLVVVLLKGWWGLKFKLVWFEFMMWVVCSLPVVIGRWRVLNLNKVDGMIGLLTSFVLNQCRLDGSQWRLWSAQVMGGWIPMQRRRKVIFRSRLDGRDGVWCWRPEFVMVCVFEGWCCWQVDARNQGAERFDLIVF